MSDELELTPLSNQEHRALMAENRCLRDQLWKLRGIEGEAHALANENDRLRYELERADV